MLVVYFEPRTGIIRRDRWESNFYIYRLRNSRVPVDNGKTIPWLEHNVANAKVGDNGLEYPAEFWNQLDIMERGFNTAVKRLSNLGTNAVSDVPPKQDGSLS